MFRNKEIEAVEVNTNAAQADFLIGEVLTGDEFTLLRETLRIYRNLAGEVDDRAAM